MAVLTDKSIKEAIQSGEIEITPYNEAQLGSNSYDLTLAPELMVYKPQNLSFSQKIRNFLNDTESSLLQRIKNLFKNEIVLDSREINDTQKIAINSEGYLLKPDILYLATTNELTYCQYQVPTIEGKSSIARLGINVHQTAGYGDIGFRGQWTLEITVTHAVRVYPNMKIAQISFNSILGECETPYDKKQSAKYNNQVGIVASKNYENFIETDNE